ncbi:MAG: PAS domain-containing protein, partial [Pseudomonadota bacterium]
MFVSKLARLGTLPDQLRHLPVALSIADASHDDQPLILVTSEFAEMTGYGQDALDRNCRFLQTDLNNSEARAEIRDALKDERRTQVILHNRRKSGETFYNLLWLEPIRSPLDNRKWVLGSQFDLGNHDPRRESEGDINTLNHRNFDLLNRTESLRLERRRLVASAAVQI